LGCVLSHLMDFNAGWFRLRLCTRSRFSSSLGLVFPLRVSHSGTVSLEFDSQQATPASEEGRISWQEGGVPFPFDDWVHGLCGRPLLPRSRRAGFGRLAMAGLRCNGYDLSVVVVIVWFRQRLLLKPPRRKTELKEFSPLSCHFWTRACVG
jgi:hypothetical protein